jgi:hypothetical protein
VLRKPTEKIVLEFMGALKPKPEDGSGDVKYHLGLSVTRPTTGGKQVCRAFCLHVPLILFKTHRHTSFPVCFIHFFAGQHQSPLQPLTS